MLIRGRLSYPFLRSSQVPKKDELIHSHPVEVFPAKEEEELLGYL